MYSGPLYQTHFQPDPTAFRHAEERRRYAEQLCSVPPTFIPPKEEKQSPVSAPLPVKGELTPPKNLAALLDLVSPEDSALIALIVFLLCDNTENDVVMLGILLYVLLSK